MSTAEKDCLKPFIISIRSYIIRSPQEHGYREGLVMPHPFQVMVTIQRDLETFSFLTTKTCKLLVSVYVAMLADIDKSCDVLCSFCSELLS